MSADYRIFVTGITGIHGWPIWQSLRNSLGENAVLGVCPPAIAHVPDGNVESICITDRRRLMRIRREFQPNYVLHCAGVCDLDVCEDRPDWAYDLNVNGTKAIADIFGDSCPIVYMSTDLVFSGNNPPAGGYCEVHVPDPVSVAGKTFRLAEQIILALDNSCIIRLGLPLGDSITGDKGAIDWVASRLLKQRPVTLFYDELRSCIWCDQIAQMAHAVLALRLKGLYHFGGLRPWQLYEIGKHVVEKYNCDPKLLKGINRHEEVDGPPRVGDITINCDKLKAILSKSGIIIPDFN